MDNTMTEWVTYGRNEAQELVDAEGTILATVEPYRGPATRSAAAPDAWLAFKGDVKLGKFRTIREAKAAIKTAK